MPPYLHILIRVEEDGSLHAQGAFTSKEKQEAYQKEAGLSDEQVRLDYFNGPVDKETEVIYAGHRRWNMSSFQIGGYFMSENDAWAFVSQEGYVNVLRIDTTYEQEKQFEKEALELYAKLQKKWRLTSYKKLAASEGTEKAKANITLRFYEDALESLKPKTKRDLRALYAFAVSILIFPIAVYFYWQSGPKWGENLPSVEWLPDYASNVSFYKSDQVDVYEFRIAPSDFRIWAGQNGMEVMRLTSPLVLSRYKAYIPKPDDETAESDTADSDIDIEEFRRWQNEIRVEIEMGLIAKGTEDATAAFDVATQKAYYEHLK